MITVELRESGKKEKRGLGRSAEEEVREKKEKRTEETTRKERIVVGSRGK